MKKFYLSLAAAAMVLGSCTDLDVAIETQYTSYPDSPIAQDAVASDCYVSHRSSWENWYSGIAMMGTVTGGESIAIALGTDYYDSGCRMRATLHSILPDDYTLGWYSDLQSGITKCNKALVSLGLDGEEVSQVSAQIRTARAFYHFILMDYFGDTPKLDHIYEDDEPVERAPRKEIAEWIESELLAVRDYLPKELNNATYAKPTRWVADAILAKLYINWAVYTCGDVTTYTPSTANSKLNDCIAVCDDIISSGIFDLTDDYKTKFLPSNGIKVKDFIYAIQYTASDKDGNVYGRYHTWRRGQNDGNGGAGLHNIALTNSVAGCFVMNPDFSALFNLPGDRRNDCLYGNDEGGVVYQYGADYEKTSTPTYYKGQAVAMTKTVELATIYDDAGNKVAMGPLYDHIAVENNMTGWTQGWRTNKLILNPTEYNTYSRNCSNDAPIFRYADILLTKAEAILRGGSATLSDTPMSLFNQIRNCAHAPLISANPSLQELLDERGREFFDEGWRRNDMIRFGQYENPSWYIHVINPNASDKHWRIFPIPTSVMDSNTNWTQNEGYK